MTENGGKRISEGKLGVWTKKICDRRCLGTGEERSKEFGRNWMRMMRAVGAREIRKGKGKEVDLCGVSCILMFRLS